MKPRVSIVMPTYNRHDTILRAIGSVRAQSFDDWELLVVDDGSTDGTSDCVEGLDPRLRVLRQENQGVAGARNTGLAAARGELVAFLDSDDAWPSHHLALATAFFDAHPDEQAWTSEFWEDFGHARYVKHFQVETGQWYPATAARIGSSAFAAPPPEGDPYLWFYETRRPVGEWARAALEGTSYGPAYEYRGRIFQGWRWGWLMALQPTVITRRAMEAVGPNDTRYRVASDFGYLATLCRLFPMNFVSVPGCIKHEYRDDLRAPTEGHLVTGATATRFHEDVLRFHEELFWKQHPADPELSSLRGFRQVLVAREALRQGRCDLARELLEEAVRSFPGSDTSSLLMLTRLPRAQLGARVYRGWLRGARALGRLRRALTSLEARVHLPSRSVARASPAAGGLS